MGIFVRTLAGFGFSSVQIACLRIIFGALLFVNFAGIFRRDFLRIHLKDCWLFACMGIVSMLLFTVCYFTVIRLSSLSTAAILLYTSPIWVMLFSAVCFREAITPRKLLAAALAFGGCALVSGLGAGSSLSVGVIVLGLLSAVGYGLYSIFGTLALRRYPPLTVTTYAFLFGAVGTVFLCHPAQVVRIIAGSANCWGLLGLILLTAFVTAVLPYLLYTLGLSCMNASTAAIMASIEPVVATSAGAVVFSEALSLPAAVGICLVLAAIVLLNTGKTAAA